MRTGILVVVVAFVAGCSGYSKFYTQVATPELVAQTRAGPPPAKPGLYHSSGNPPDVVAEYEKHGYGLIGYSSFNSGGAGTMESGAVDEGKKVGADVVVVMLPKHTGTVTTAMPVTTPTSSTSYTNGSGTVYGSGGSANYSGSATTTTYGSTTNYIPYTINRFDYGALYLVKRHIVFGVNTRALNDQERAALQSNKGIYVRSVVEGSPAFREDVLPGDVIVSIDGQPVFAEGLSDLLRKSGGHKVDVSIVRNGTTLTKSVQLNP